MTPELVREMVAGVQQAADDGDHERAHGREDNAHHAVIAYFAEKAPDPWGAIAREALKTLSIDFERWCA